MTPVKPYLVRAIFEWCADQGFTPYLTVRVDAHTRVPKEHVKNGEITLNIGAEATHQLQMGNEEITFHARFSGAAYAVAVPVGAITAIFARENGQGMAFEPSSPSERIDSRDTESENLHSPSGTVGPSPDKKRPTLTRIK